MQLLNEIADNRVFLGVEQVVLAGLFVYTFAYRPLVPRLKRLIARKRTNNLAAKANDYLSRTAGIVYREELDELDVSFGRQGMVATVPILDSKGLPIEGWFETTTLDLESSNGFVIKNFSKYVSFMHKQEKFMGIGFPILPEPEDRETSAHVAKLIQHLGNVAKEQTNPNQYTKELLAMVGYAIRLISATAKANNINLKALLRGYQGTLLTRSSLAHSLQESEPEVSKVETNKVTNTDETELEVEAV